MRFTSMKRLLVAESKLSFFASRNKEEREEKEKKHIRRTSDFLSM